MRKDNKNEAVPQVTKANASAIKQRINSNSEKVPLTFSFERTGISLRTAVRSVEVDFYNKPYFTSSWTHNQQRSAFIYQVIHNKLYYNVEGNKLGVSDMEIFTKFTQLTYSVAEIELLTHRTEFEEYLFDCYLQELKTEQAEDYAYKFGSVFNQLMSHNSTPKLIYGSLKQLSNTIRSVDSELQSIYAQLKYNRIDGVEFDKLRIPLDKRLKSLRKMQEYLLFRYKQMVETKKYRRRTLLQKAFKTARRTLDSISYQPVECGTVSLCTFYIEEYCRWFNRTFKQEIVETSRLDKLAKRKQKRSERKKPNPRLEILKPFLNSGVPEQCIADQTGIPKSTVNRLMKKLV